MREDQKETIEVHVAGICFEDDRVLILKRSPARTLFPNLWECGGGQVHRGESFEEAVRRKFREETGIRIEPVAVLKTYEIETRDEAIKIPGVKLICRFENYESGEAPQISTQHTEYRWQPVNELDSFDFIPGIREEITEAYTILKGKN